MINPLAGLNWMKIGLYAVVIVAIFGAGWLMGGNRERVRCAEEHAKDIAVLMEDQNKQIGEYNKELAKRVNIADAATKRYYDLREEVKATQGGINEEIDKRAPAASCGPSDREYELYKSAASQTRNP